MKRVVGYLAAVTVAMVMFAPSSAFAQEDTRLRRGFWFNGGLGWGEFDCEGCQGGGVGGGIGVLAIGGTLSQKLILGASSNVWVKDDDDVTSTVAALTAMVRFYPSRTGRFYLLGGLGIGTRESETEIGGGTFTVSENGTAAMLGLGYDVRLGRNISLTPFANGVGLDFDGQSASFTQVGLSITVH